MPLEIGLHILANQFLEGYCKIVSEYNPLKNIIFPLQEILIPLHSQKYSLYHNSLLHITLVRMQPFVSTVVFAFKTQINRLLLNSVLFRNATLSCCFRWFAVCFFVL